MVIIHNYIGGGNEHGINDTSLTYETDREVLEDMIDLMVASGLLNV